MPAPAGFPTGSPIWMDLNSRDVEVSKAFYERLFGWTSVDAGPDFGGYVNFLLNGKGVAGMVGNQMADVPDFWTVYLQADDLEATAQAVTGAGGMVFMGPHSVADLGTMLVAADADRATVGGWTPGTHKGFELLAEPGAPAWFELHTTNFDDEIQFYQQAFGWQTKSMADTPEFRYSQLMIDEQPYAGVMDASAYWPAGDPGAWLVYINVADPDEVMSRVASLGGKVVDALADTPFGRMGTISDPTGALIKIIS